MLSTWAAGRYIKNNVHLLEEVPDLLTSKLITLPNRLQSDTTAAPVPNHRKNPYDFPSIDELKVYNQSTNLQKLRPPLHPFLHHRHHPSTHQFVKEPTEENSVRRLPLGGRRALPEPDRRGINGADRLESVNHVQNVNIVRNQSIYVNIVRTYIFIIKFIVTNALVSYDK